MRAKINIQRGYNKVLRRKEGKILPTWDCYVEKFTGEKAFKNGKWDFDMSIVKEVI